MKKILSSMLMLTGIFIFSTGARCQVNQPYWTENFDDSSAAQLTGTTANAPTSPVTYTLTSGAWTFYYAFRGGTGCVNDAVPVSAKAIRILQTAVTSPAGIVPPAYVITPTVAAGIGTITWNNAKNTASSTTGVYKSTNGGTSWVLVLQVPTTALACDGYTLPVNDPLANKIKFTNDNVSAQLDIDHITLNSFVSILPVTLQSSKAYQKNTGIQVEWSTAQEMNVIRYVVEKSTDGKSFTDAGFVNAKGNSTSVTDYAWLDAAPFAGNNFYRIRAIDADGKFKITSIMKVSITGGKMSLIISPNPVRGKSLNLQLVNAARGSYMVNLYNTTGQKIFTGEVKSDGGSSSQSVPLPAAVKPGTYNLQLISGDSKLNKTIVVE